MIFVKGVSSIPVHMVPVEVLHFVAVFLLKKLSPNILQPLFSDFCVCCFIYNRTSSVSFRIEKDKPGAPNVGFIQRFNSNPLPVHVHNFYMLRYNSNIILALLFSLQIIDVSARSPGWQ